MTCRTLLTAPFSLLLVSLAFGQQGIQTPAQPATPFSLTQVWALDATYTDQQHGVSFRYPSVWKPGTQFGYHPPALTESEERPIAGFGYEEGSFPRSSVIGPYSATNLEGFGIVYSAVAAAGVAECDAKASSLSETPEHRVVRLNGRFFTEYETGQAGMSQSNSGKLYVTYLRPTCYLFETDVAVLSEAMDTVQALTPGQLKIIAAHLFDMMNSVRIAPSDGSP